MRWLRKLTGLVRQSLKMIPCENIGICLQNNVKKKRKTPCIVRNKTVQNIGK